MNCDLSYDNRETCTATLPSSCIPYVGYLSDLVKIDSFPCRPNINDVLKQIQVILDRINSSLGDNTTIDHECLTTLDVSVATQKDIDQRLIHEICLLKTQVALLTPLLTSIDPATIRIAVDLLCLLNPDCDPPTDYSLTEIITKLVAAICDLMTRVANIETILNI